MTIKEGLILPISLSTNAFEDPIGLGDKNPVFRWKLNCEANGMHSVAWEVEVATSDRALLEGDADLWRSGRREEPRVNQCVYGGRLLTSRSRGWWRVRIWDQKNEVSAWSEPASFEMGLLAREDWKAEWISSSIPSGPRTCPPVPYFRKPFSIRPNLKHARLYLAVLGLYELEINGQAISDRVLAPGWVDFHKRVPTHTIDVTSFLRRGENVMGCLLGDGWYSGHIANHQRQRYGESPMFLAQLEMVYEDGSQEMIASDNSWKTRSGPILYNDLIMGETYDARKELGDWSSPQYNDHDWLSVEMGTSPEIALTPTAGPFVQRQEIIECPPAPSGDDRDYNSWDGSKYIFDFGQNFTGRLRLCVHGKRGTTLTIRHAEMREPGGNIHTSNLRTAVCTDHYTLKGEGLEVYEPRFTFHGFRYAEITWSGSLEDLAFEKVEGVVLYSNMPVTGHFVCSNALLNKLQNNIVWGQKSNYLEVPTDCPQRDERLGWTGDAQVFVRTACFNFNVQPFFNKWMLDARDAQYPAGQVPAVIPKTSETPQDGGPAWSDATIICPWTIWRCYGDYSVLKDHYVSMQRYIDFLLEDSKDLIRMHPDLEIWQGFGDWLALDGATQTEGQTLKDLIGTAFLAYDCELMAEIAGVLNQTEDADRYRGLHEQVKSAFKRRFVTDDGYLVSNTQTSYVLALRFNLLPEALRDAAAKQLVRLIKGKHMHLATGFVGTPYLCQVLEENGYLDVAYALLECETFPSWLFPVKNGATTIWERWDGWTPEKGFQDPGMNSFNHYAYGAIGAWMYASVAGLEFQPDSVGYRKILFRPRPGGSLTWAEASLETPYGKTSIRWELVDEGIQLQLEVPVNAVAEISPPEGYRTSTAFLESGRYDVLLSRE